MKFSISMNLPEDFGPRSVTGPVAEIAGTGWIGAKATPLDNGTIIVGVFGSEGRPLLVCGYDVNAAVELAATIANAASVAAKMLNPSPKDASS